MTTPPTPARGSVKLESGYRSEGRLHERVKSAAIAALATDEADRERLGEMFDILSEYEGRVASTGAPSRYPTSSSTTSSPCTGSGAHPTQPLEAAARGSGPSRGRGRPPPDTSPS